MQEQLSRIASIESKVIPNFLNEQELSSIKDSIKLPSGKLNLVFVGSLSVRKQPMELIKTFEALLCDFPDSHLEIVGDGPLRSEISQYIDEKNLHSNIKLHGHLPDPEEILKSSDVFVLASKAEGLQSCPRSLILWTTLHSRAVDATRAW